MHFRSFPAADRQRHLSKLNTIDALHRRCVTVERTVQTNSMCILTLAGWGIIPAVGLAYSGYTTRSNSLSAIVPSILAVIVCTIQWFLIGYTLTYSEGGPIFGDFTYAFHRNVLAEPVGTIPAILFSFFQLVFQATVCAIAVGGACERGRILPLVPFIFVSTFSIRAL